MSLWTRYSAHRTEKRREQGAARLLIYQQERQAKDDSEAARKAAFVAELVALFKRFPEGKWISGGDIWHMADAARDRIPRDYSLPYSGFYPQLDIHTAVRTAVLKVGLRQETEPGNLRKTKGRNSHWRGKGGTDWYCLWTQEGSPPESPAAPALKRIAAAKQRERERHAAKLLRQEAQRRTHNHVRRSRELQAPGEHSTAEWLLKLEEFGHRCAYCDTEGADFHRDHLVPLVDGGSNSIGNIVPACPSCNLSKGGKSGADLLRWITERKAAGRAA